MDYPLRKENGHIIVTFGEADWMIDTGSPSSFGVSSVNILGTTHQVLRQLMGFSAEALSQAIHITVTGLIGTDILNQYHILFDLPKGIATISQEQLSVEGLILPMDGLMGIPIISVGFQGNEIKVFFDTGAQVSYCQQEMLEQFPFVMQFQDFYPGLGNFNTDLYAVEFQIGNETHCLNCGSLPPLLNATLMMSDTQGIIGNDLIENRKLGYFPLIQQMVIGSL
jgi:hypothetical protein